MRLNINFITYNLGVFSLGLRLIHNTLPLHDPFIKPHQPDRLTLPHLRAYAMRADFRRHSAAITHALDNSRHERPTIQLAHLLRHADILIDQRLIVAYHVFELVGAGTLERVRSAPKQMLPERGVYELQQGQYSSGPVLLAGREAVVEERQEAEA
jgi:hypothetical protein